VNGVISASFEGVAKEAQAGNVYTVIITPSLFGGGQPGWVSPGEGEIQRHVTPLLGSESLKRKLYAVGCRCKIAPNQWRSTVRRRSRMMTSGVRRY
jgi:hypothetical protein